VWAGDGAVTEAELIVWILDAALFAAKFFNPEEVIDAAVAEDVGGIVVVGPTVLVAVNELGTPFTVGTGMPVVAAMPLLLPPPEL
jgi:hypothetical protein